MLIPDEYVSSIGERLALYQKLDEMEDEAEIEKFTSNLIDRFGPLPVAVENLFEALRLRWSARKLGFERIMYKNRKLRCYFISNQESPFFESQYFQKMLHYIQTKTDHRFALKQTNSHLLLACEDVRTIAAAQDVLEELERAIGI